MTEGLLQGKHSLYTGVVVDIKDPDLKGRVKVRVGNDPNVNNEDLYWAELAFFDSGGPNQSVQSPEIGDGVYLMFLQGALRYPVIVGYARNKGYQRNPIIVDKPHIRERRSPLGTITYWENDANPSFGYELGTNGAFKIAPEGFQIYDRYSNNISAGKDAFVITKGGKTSRISLLGDNVQIDGEFVNVKSTADFSVVSSGDVTLESVGNMTMESTNHVKINARGKAIIASGEETNITTTGQFKVTGGAISMFVNGVDGGIPLILQDAISLVAVIGNIYMNSYAGDVSFDVGPFGIIGTHGMDFLGNYEASNIPGSIDLSLLGDFEGGNFAGSCSVDFLGQSDIGNLGGSTTTDIIGDTTIGTIIPTATIRSGVAGATIGLGIFPAGTAMNPAEITPTLMGPSFPVVTNILFIKFG